MKFIKTIGLPNRLTLLRISLIPFFMLVMFVDNLWTRIFVLIIFIIASLTDLYDGMIARRYGKVSKIGIFLDPLADKLLISAALIFFVSLRELNIPAWMIVLIISREYFVTGLRLVAISYGEVISADKIGKIKTTTQVITIIVILVILVVNSALKVYGIEINDLSIKWKYYVILFLTRVPFWIMLYVTILTVYSGILYFRKYANIVFTRVTDKI